MANVKGSAVAARLNYIKQWCTADEEARIRALLDQELQDLMNAGAFVSQWYPIRYLTDLSRAIDQVKGRGDQAMIPELGAQSAKEALKGIYKIFFKFGSPEFIIQRAAQVWGRYYDSGRLDVTPQGKGKVHVALRGFDEPSHDHCLSVQGWIKGMLELSGGKNVVVTNTQCRKQGARDCEFEAVWQ